MNIKNWHVNAIVRITVLGSFVLGVKYADTKIKASNPGSITVEESDGSHVLDNALEELQNAIVKKDMKSLKSLMTGNGFSLSDKDYETFLNQFKTKGDAIKFVNAIRRQASDFAKGVVSENSYYFADGNLDQVKFKVNHITAELTFGTLGKAVIGDEEYNLNKNRVIEVKELLPFNQTITSKVDGKWEDKEDLKIFNSFIGNSIKTGDKCTVKGRLFDNGAGIVVHINSNVDNGILYVNGSRTNRTVSSGGCYRDKFSEGDKLRVEFGGEQSKEFKVSKENLNANLNIDLDEFIKQDEIKKEDHLAPKLTAKNFFKAVEKCVRHGNTKDLDDLMAPGYEPIAEQSLRSFLNAYDRINFTNVYYNSVNTDSSGNSNVSATFQYAAETLEGVYMKAEGAATIQLNSENKIIGFTIN